MKNTTSNNIPPLSPIPSNFKSKKTVSTRNLSRCNMIFHLHWEQKIYNYSYNIRKILSKSNQDFLSTDFIKFNFSAFLIYLAILSFASLLPPTWSILHNAHFNGPFSEYNISTGIANAYR